MKVKILFIILLGFFCLSNSHARKPAVEDFVGVVPHDYKITPKGTEVLFDFGNKVNKISTIDNPESDFNSTWPKAAGFIIFISLPFFMWFFITRFGLKPASNKDSELMATTELEDDSSKIKHLDDFRTKPDPGKEKKVS